jgi:hypothetical protein
LLVWIVLKGAAFHFIDAIMIRIKIPGGHIAGFVAFLPVEGEDVFAGFKERLKQFYIVMRGAHELRSIAS